MGPNHYTTEHLTTYRRERKQEAIDTITRAFEQGGMIVKSIDIEEIEEPPKKLIQLFHNINISEYDALLELGLDEAPWEIQFDGESFWINDFLNEYRTRIDFGKCVVSIDRGLH